MLEILQNAVPPERFAPENKTVTLIRYDPNDNRRAVAGGRIIIVRAENLEIWVTSRG